MIAAGDMNSYHQPSIDHNGGPSVVRPESLSSHLLSLGFCDTFRHRFSTMPAFTHIFKSGGSRLDQIWIRPAPELTLGIVLACIIREWEFKSDHCPVVADLFTTIPIIHDVVERPQQPPWRALLTDLKDKELNAKIRESVLVRIGPYKEVMEANRCHLSRVREAARNHDNMDPGSARAIIENA